MSGISHIHLDAVGGIAGDMFAAAMLDALPHLEARVFSDLAAVLPPSCGTPELTRGMSHAISVRRFSLVPPAGSEARPHHHHGRGHDHHHDHGEPASGRVETFRALVGRIRCPGLSRGTAEVAEAILTRLAEAESRVHGVPLEEVHFHEIADWDSLMDVVAAASLIAAVGDAVTWSVSDLPRGNGLVHTAHGFLPVPVPAVAELLRGFVWRTDGIDGERVTPTGAAILAQVVDPRAVFHGRQKLLSSGTGAGTRTLAEIPNILRALIFGEQETAASTGDEIIVVAFDIDDMTGEEIAVAADHLRSADGVLDLTLGNRFGKKNRPVTDFRLMIRVDAFERICALCFEETSTIGLRYRKETRVCLPRTAGTVAVAGRPLRRKSVVRAGGAVTFKVESDDLAAESGLTARRARKSSGEQIKPA